MVEINRFPEVSDAAGLSLVPKSLLTCVPIENHTSSQGFVSLQDHPKSTAASIHEV